MDFCDLFRYPARCRCKTVETTAIYIVDIEHVAFFCARCIPEASANAAFTVSTRGTKNWEGSAAQLRPALLTVTVIATFVDEYVGNMITCRGNRYPRSRKWSRQPSSTPLPNTTQNISSAAQDTS